MDTLSGELWDGSAEEGVSVVVTEAHVIHTDVTERVDIQKVLAAAEWSTGKDLITILLKNKMKRMKISIFNLHNMHMYNGVQTNMGYVVNDEKWEHYEYFTVIMERLFLQLFWLLSIYSQI